MLSLFLGAEKTDKEQAMKKEEKKAKEEAKRGKKDRTGRKGKSKRRKKQYLCLVKQVIVGLMIGKNI